MKKNTTALWHEVNKRRSSSSQMLIMFFFTLIVSLNQKLEMTGQDMQFNRAVCQHVIIRFCSSLLSSSTSMCFYTYSSSHTSLVREIYNQRMRAVLLYPIKMCSTVELELRMQYDSLESKFISKFCVNVLCVLLTTVCSKPWQF